MENNKLTSTIIEVLKVDERLWNEDQTELNQTLLLDLIDGIDEKVIGLILQNDSLRDKFFVKIKDAYVFKINDFKFFMEENKIDNSYTKYKNRIGLTDGKKFLKDTNDVVLDFPYKDCVLEGGQSTEEGTDSYFEYEEEKIKTVKGEKVTEEAGYKERQSKRKEIFFNQVLAQDEIDRLFDEKALVNWKRYTKNGEQDIEEIKRDENGFINENLIIKGNNLLALHSLKSQFTGKVKLIYIDPPYNTGSDEFKYNDNFNHSAWLTFMKNRLEEAKKLLRDDGGIYIHIDHHQISYLNVLMDNIFKKENKVQLISVKTASPAGFKTVNPGPIDVTEYILFYTKKKSSFKFKKGFVPVGYNKNYNLFLNKADNVEEWSFTPIKSKVLSELGFENEKEAKDKYGYLWKSIYGVLLENFAYKNAENIVSIRDPHKPTKTVQELMDLSKEKEVVIEYKRDDSSSMFLYKGGALAFYSNKMKNIDGKQEITELLTDFWNHISWAGIANEGGVKLKNGKKPEKLLKQIIELATEEGDIVLDYHLGSGTTCAVAHKMGRQYIGIEQLDYGENDSVIRLQNVINGDQTGISKAVKWQGGRDFLYCELAKWNEQAKDQINDCNSLNELEKLFDTLYEKYFLNYNLKTKEFKEKVIKEDNFKKLSLNEQKRMFLTMLDLNQMYVQKTEMEDTGFGISKEDQKLTTEFYNEER